MSAGPSSSNNSGSGNNGSATGGGHGGGGRPTSFSRRLHALIADIGADASKAAASAAGSSSSGSTEHKNEESRVLLNIKVAAVMLMRALPYHTQRFVAIADIAVCLTLFLVARKRGHHHQGYAFSSSLLDIEVIALVRGSLMLLIPAPPTLPLTLAALVAAMLATAKLLAFDAGRTFADIFIACFAVMGVLHAVAAAVRPSRPRFPSGPSQSEREERWLLGGFVDGSFSKTTMTSGAGAGAARGERQPASQSGSTFTERGGGEGVGNGRETSTSSSSSVLIGGNTYVRYMTRGGGSAGRGRGGDEEAGDCDGAGIVCVHGYGGSGDVWRGVLDACVHHTGGGSGGGGGAGILQFVALDRPGYGGTAAADVDALSLDSQAEMLIGVCEAAGIRRAVFVGHDDGALLALYTAVATMMTIGTDDVVRCAGIVLVSPVLAAESTADENKDDAINTSLTAGIIPPPNLGGASAHITPRFVRNILGAPLPTRVKQQLLRGVLSSSTLLRRGGTSGGGSAHADVHTLAICARGPVPDGRALPSMLESRGVPILRLDAQLPAPGTSAALEFASTLVRFASECLFFRSPPPTAPHSSQLERADAKAAPTPQ